MTTALYLNNFPWPPALCPCPVLPLTHHSISPCLCNYLWWQTRAHPNKYQIHRPSSSSTVRQSTERKWIVCSSSSTCKKVWLKILWCYTLSFFFHEMKVSLPPHRIAGIVGGPPRPVQANMLRNWSHSHECAKWRPPDGVWTEQGTHAPRWI